MTIARALSGMDWNALEAAYSTLQTDAARVVAETIPTAVAPAVQRLADMRFMGQGYELVTLLPLGPYTARSEPAIRAAFERGYESVFGRRPPVAEIEIINIRISLSASAGGGELNLDIAKGGTAPGPHATRRARFAGNSEPLAAPVYERANLAVGSSLTGPAIIEEASSTLLVPPGAMASVDSAGNILIELPAA
jgi:N-methylhydantoinase A